MHIARIRPLRRAIHATGDLVLAGWCLVWALVAWGLKSIVDTLAIPAQGISDQTATLATRLDDTARQLRDVALVGEQLAQPFGPMADSLRGLSRQAAEQVQTVHDIGWLLFFVVFLMPSLTVALLYLPPRIRRARESAAARAYVDQLSDLDLFALRAMAKAPMTKLAKISSDPAGAWRRGDQETIRALADLELKRVGIGVVEVEGTTSRPTSWGTSEFR